MQYSCYIEVNLICLILSAIVYARLRQNRSIHSTSQLIMRRLNYALWALCVSDIAAVVLRGRFFPGARFLIQGSNLIYISMMPVISMFWYAYVCNRVGWNRSRLRMALDQLPLTLFVLIALGNPITQFLFTINEQNLYSRGPGILLHWIFSLYYMVYAGVLTIRAIRTAPNWARRSEYKPLLYSLILPAIGSATQMLFYGVTTVQVGITLSIVLISFRMQDNQVSVDELTGINNRMAMRRYVDNIVHKDTPPMLTVLMIDVNQFKKINDTLGHAVGDIALCDTADILRSVCGKSRDRLFLSRYGGDEFVVIGKDTDHAAAEKLVENIHQEISRFNETQQRPYTLDVSVGFAIGPCEDYEDFSHFMRTADEAMYDDKKKRKAAR